LKDYLPDNLQKDLPSIDELVNIVKKEIWLFVISLS
jgi:hypothetical protein